MNLGHRNEFVKAFNKELTDDQRKKLVAVFEEMTMTIIKHDAWDEDTQNHCLESGETLDIA